MDFSAYLSSKQKQIETKLDELIPERNNNSYKQLFQAARYALLNGGKRLRPLLTLITSEMLGGKTESALSSACALEMVHTYSLIHDDLPCMDDDDFRRGQPSLHKAFSEGHAVLAGDFLLTYAFEVISNDAHLQDDQKIALVKLLAKNSGGEGMIGGQIMDIEAKNQHLDIEKLQQIHRRKTGAMITASIEFGGIVAGASPTQMEILRRFGDDLGLAFQIIDDVIDVTGSMQKHGKTISSDEMNNKCTYVSLLGLETAKQAAHALLLKAEKELDAITEDTTVLRKVSQRLVYREI